LKDLLNMKNDTKTNISPKNTLAIQASAWTFDRIKQMSRDDISNLSHNATIRGQIEVAELCQSILKTLPTIKNIKGKKSTSTSAENESENLAVEFLEKFGRELIELYDLSEKTARKLSPNIPKFTPHKFMGKDGFVKTGGKGKKGALKFDKYISYRIQNETLVFSAVKPKETSDILYEIQASLGDLPAPKKLSELRPDANVLGIDREPRYAQYFSDFDEAANLFKLLIDKFAPKTQQVSN